MDFRKIGYTEGWISVVLNILLSSIKFWLAVVAGSVAMIADAWYTLSDTLTSFVLVIGIRVSEKPADHHHPRGHRLAEPLAGIIIATLVAAVGASFLYESVVRLVQYRVVTYQPVAVIVFGVSVVLKEALAWYAFWGEKATGSTALHAEGWHHRTEAIAAALIVIGFFMPQSFWWMDQALGIGISLLILYTSYDNIREAFLAILGRKADEKTEKAVAEIAGRETGGALAISHLTVFQYNGNVHYEAHVKIPSGGMKSGLDAALDKVRAAVRTEMNAGMEFFIGGNGKG